MMTKISIIIPVYNVAAYLPQCLDSILKQSFKDFEIILVNDGSTDNSLSVCQIYQQQDSRISIINQPNQGVAMARNVGLDNSHSNTIMFVDPDDWLSNNNVLETLYSIYLTKNVDIVIGNFDEFNMADSNYHLFDHSNKTRLFTPHEWFKFEYDDRENRSQCFSTPWAKLYRKELFEHITFPVGLIDEDDLTIWKLYLKATKLAYLNSAVYIYRNNRPESITKVANPAQLFSIPAMEERITVQHLIGFNDIIKRNRSYYYWRLHIHSANALKIGEISNYKNATLKEAIIQKYQESIE